MDSRLGSDMSEEEKRELREDWFPRLMAQRTGTAAQYKTMRALNAKIAKFQYTKAKFDPEERDPQRIKVYKAKLAEEAELKSERGVLQAELDRVAREKMHQFIANPPKPLGDVRRADEHRAAFAGKTVKNKNRENWSGMAATAGVLTPENKKGVGL